MNSVNLIGNLTRDPEVRYTENQTAVCTFSLAIDRGKDKQGEELGADFPRIVAFGKTAENCGKYLSKGRKAAVMGRIQTGSYQNNNGDTVYTTDIVASRVEFLSSPKDNNNSAPSDIPEGFEPVDDEDIPF